MSFKSFSLVYLIIRKFMYRRRISENKELDSNNINTVPIKNSKDDDKLWRKIVLKIARHLISIRSSLENVFSQTEHPEVGPYIQILVTLYWISSVCLMTPIYLAYCPQRKLYVVRKCHFLQRIACLISLIWMQPSLFRQGVAVWSSLEGSLGSRNVGPYFDLANEFYHDLCMFHHGYIHYFQLDMISNYVEILQTTSLIHISNLRVWKARFVTIYMFIVIIWSGIYFVIFVYQIDWTSPSAFIQSGEKSARYIFWLPDDFQVSTGFSLAVIWSRFYHGIYHHTAHSTFCYVPFFPLFFMSGNFFSIILQQETFTVPEVLDYYEDYKAVLTKGNLYFNQYTFLYITILITYHSVHVFDILSSDNFLWKFNVMLYLYMASIVFYYPMKTLLHTKKLKKWLWMDQHFMKIPKQQLVLILYDQYSWVQSRRGIKCGRYLVISPEQAGKVFQQVCSMALLIKLNSYNLNNKQVK